MRSWLIGITLLLLGCGMRKETGYLQAGKLSVYYERSGAGEPLLFVHAGFMDHTMWDKQVAFFEKNFTVITIDLPRSGRTSGNDTITQVSDLIRSCLDQLGVNKTSVVGLSFGSACSIEFALAYPNRLNSLVLAAPGLQGAQETLPIDSLSMRYFTLAGDADKTKDYQKIAAAFTQNWAIGPFRSSNEMDTSIRNFVRTHVLTTLEKHAGDSWANFKTDPPAATVLSSIKNRTLVIYADKDIPFINTIAEYIHRSIAGSEIIKFTNSAHMINMEQPERFNNVLDSFLRKKTDHAL